MKLKTIIVFLAILINFTLIYAQNDEYIQKATQEVVKDHIKIRIDKYTSLMEQFTYLSAAGKENLPNIKGEYSDLFINNPDKIYVYNDLSRDKCLKEKARVDTYYDINCNFESYISTYSRSFKIDSVVYYKENSDFIWSPKVDKVLRERIPMKESAFKLEAKKYCFTYSILTKESSINSNTTNRKEKVVVFWGFNINKIFKKKKRFNLTKKKFRELFKKNIHEVKILGILSYKHFNELIQVDRQNNKKILDIQRNAISFINSYFKHTDNLYEKGINSQSLIQDYFLNEDIKIKSDIITNNEFSDSTYTLVEYFKMLSKYKNVEHTINNTWQIGNIMPFRGGNNRILFRCENKIKVGFESNKKTYKNIFNIAIDIVAQIDCSGEYKDFKFNGINISNLSLSEKTKKVVIKPPDETIITNNESIDLENAIKVFETVGKEKTKSFLRSITLPKANSSNEDLNKLFCNNGKNHTIEISNHNKKDETIFKRLDKYHAHLNSLSYSKKDLNPLAKEIEPQNFQSRLKRLSHGKYEGYIKYFQNFKGVGNSGGNNYCDYTEKKIQLIITKTNNSYNVCIGNIRVTKTKIKTCE